MARKPELPEAADFFTQDTAQETREAKNKTLKPQNSKAVKQPMPVREQMEGGPPRSIESGVTEKVTFYISPELLKRLELTKVQLLLERNLKISRSQIVEVILEQMVGETERIGDLLE